MNAPDQPAAQHELVRLVYRLVGDVAGHAGRLAGVEVQIEAIAGALDAIEKLAAAIPRRLDPAIAALPGVGIPGADRAEVDPASGGDGSGIDPGIDPAGVNEPADEPADEGLDMRLLVDWVREHVALLVERKVPQTGGYPHWCRKWWLHPEAIARFEATRRAWAEAVVAGGAAMVIWFEHLDAQLAVLCAESGPFANCARGHADRILTIGQDDPDPAYFTALDHALDHALDAALDAALDGATAD